MLALMLLQKQESSMEALLLRKMLLNLLLRETSMDSLSEVLHLKKHSLTLSELLMKQENEYLENSKKKTNFI